MTTNYFDDRIISMSEAIDFPYEVRISVPTPEAHAELMLALGIIGVRHGGFIFETISAAPVAVATPEEAPSPRYRPDMVLRVEDPKEGPIDVVTKEDLMAYAERARGSSDAGTALFNALVRGEPKGTQLRPMQSEPTAPFIYKNPLGISALRANKLPELHAKLQQGLINVGGVGGSFIQLLESYVADMYQVPELPEGESPGNS